MDIQKEDKNTVETVAKLSKKELLDLLAFLRTKVPECVRAAAETEATKRHIEKADVSAWRKVRFPIRFTSANCSKCQEKWLLDVGDLEAGHYTCNDCGSIEDIDYLSALNIWQEPPAWPAVAAIIGSVVVKIVGSLLASSIASSISYGRGIRSMYHTAERLNEAARVQGASDILLVLLLLTGIILFVRKYIMRRRVAGTFDRITDVMQKVS